MKTHGTPGILRTAMCMLGITACTFLAVQLNAATDRYRLMLRDDPATTMVIGWDQVSGSNPMVYYGPVDHGTNWSSYPSSQAPDRVINYLGMNNHFVRLTGLTPNAPYYFVIRDSNGNSQRFWFKTAPADNGQRLSLIAGGDSRNNRTPRQNANRLVAKLRPHAVFFGGDMTANGSSSEWLEWMNDWQLTIGSDGRMIPIVAARGNHESSNTIIVNLFDVPDPNVYYALTFGGNLIRSYTLNTEISISGSQTNWLSNDLDANAGVLWKMAQYHKPMRPHVSSKSEGTSQYSNWAQMFYDKGVRVVVECDAHTVKTTWPVMPSNGSGSDEGFVREDDKGTVYVGEGCWGAPLRSNDDNKTWTRASASFNQFKWIFVNKDTIEIRTINVDNATQVGTVNDNNIFTPPSNLNIWNPSSGSVVYITRGQDPNQAPSVNVTGPSNGNFYAAPQTITVTADAVDADGTISQVEFFVNGNSIGIDQTPYYSVSWTIPANGSYVIHAVATDDDGAKTTSDVVTITVGSYSDTYCGRISRSEDDVEESEAGAIYMNSSDIELVYDAFNNNGNQVIGLFFPSVTIPNGAVIDKAYIQFQVDETGTAACDLEIRCEASDNATPFSGASYEVSSAVTTMSGVNWSVPAWTMVGAVGADQRTPDLTAIVQEVVDRNGWQANNALKFIITGTGARIAEAYDGDTGAAAQLCIDYTVSFPTAVTPKGTTPFSVRIAPNPMVGDLQVLLNGHRAGAESCRVTVYDLTGRKYLQKTIALSGGRNSFWLDTSDLTSGYYVVNVMVGNQSVTERFVKQ